MQQSLFAFLQRHAAVCFTVLCLMGCGPTPGDKQDHAAPETDQPAPEEPQKETMNEKMPDNETNEVKEMKEMDRAILKARNTLDEFRQALRSGKLDRQYTGLKNRFVTPLAEEHVWLTDITLRNDTFFGVIGSLPFSSYDFKSGDTIPVLEENISDWIYMKDGKFYGGYTLRVQNKSRNDARRN